MEPKKDVDFEDVFAQVISNEKTARIMMRYLQTRGVEVSVDPEKLKLEDLQEVLIGVYSELSRRDRLTGVVVKEDGYAIEEEENEAN